MHSTSQYSTIWWSDHHQPGHIIVYSTSQYSTTWWSDHCALHQLVQYHTKSDHHQPGQIIMHSTSQYSTTWWSDHHAFHQSVQYHRVVRSLCTPPASTVPHKVRSSSARSDHRAFNQSVQYHMVARWKACAERHGACSVLNPFFVTVTHLHEVSSTIQTCNHLGILPRVCSNTNSASLIRNHQKQRSAVNAMSDSCRRSWNIS